MKPESIQKLQQNVPELKELIAFLSSEVQKLNTLDDLADLDVTERHDALSGKLWAYKTLSTMLAPLIGTVPETHGADPSEYVA